MTVTGISASFSDYGTQNAQTAAAAARRVEAELKSGLEATQTDSAMVQQALQNQAAQSQAIYSHGSLTGPGEPSEAIALYGALDHAVESGNLAAAQGAYSALAQQLQQYTSSGQEPAVPNGSDVSVSA
jgi:hypothetical protein